MIEIETRPGQHKNLTDNLQSLYAYIADYQLKHHAPPSRKMMLVKMGIGNTTLRSCLNLLEEQGHLKCLGYGWWIVTGIEYVDKRNDKA